MIIKICGITRQHDADCIQKLGVDMCGFIFHPRSPRAVSPELAAMLRTGTVQRVGIFVGQHAVDIKRIMSVAKLTFAQLHGEQSTACAQAVGAERVIRVLWPERYSSTAALQAALEAYAPTCAYFLFDAGQQGGGSGRFCHWSLLQGLHSPRPFLVAGGLNAATLPQCLSLCQPDGVDFNSGIEVRAGIKHALRLHEAVQAARGWGTKDLCG